MSDTITDNELSEFMKELAKENTGIPEKAPSNFQPTVITDENFDEILQKEIGGVLDTCKTVSETLAERIDAGDNYEGTMMGFAQATDNLMKALKFLETRENMKMKHILEMEKMRQAHEYRKVEIEKRNEGKSNGVKNVTNVFVGSRDEFLKQASGSVLNNAKEVLLEEKTIELEDSK